MSKMLRLSLTLIVSSLLLNTTLAAAPRVTCTAKTVNNPANPTKVCDRNGTLPDAYTLQRFSSGAFKADNITVCRDVTYSYPGWFYSYGYDPVKKWCYSFRKDLYVLNPSGPGPIIYYDFTCFNCTLNCPLPSKQNTVFNGDFENGRTDGGVAPLSGANLTTPGNGSPTAALSAEEYPDIRAYPPPHCPGNIGYYYVSIDWKNTFTGIARTTIPDAYSVYSETQANYLNNGTSDVWKKWEDYHPIWYNDDISLSLSTSNRNPANFSKLYADNFNVYYLGNSFSAQSNAANLVTNGAFENTNISPWSADPYTKVVSPGLKGSARAISFYNSGDYFTPSTLTQIVKLVKGQHYLLSFDWQTNGTSGLYSSSYTFSNGADSGYYRDDLFPQGQASGTLKKPFVAQTSTANFTLSFRLDDPSFIVDNIAIQLLLRS